MVFSDGSDRSDRSAVSISLGRARARRDAGERLKLRGSVATHRALFATSGRPTCDRCGARVYGAPAGRGLLVWARGDERRFEEPPLCDDCAPQIAMLGQRQFDATDEEEG
jgi:hypothetical protein